MKKNGWFMVATGAIVLSLISLLLPIVTYQNSQGISRSFNVFAIAFGRDFERFVFSEYTGSFLYGLDYGIIGFLSLALCLVGIGAIVMAFVGINSMTKQYESSQPFVLAVMGLVGTAIPSLTLLVLALISGKQYLGTLHLGAYIFVTPLAMLCAIAAVTARHRLSREEAQAAAAAAAYIRPAGDLPIIDPKDLRRNDYYVR